MFGLGTTRVIVEMLNDLAKSFGEQWDIVAGTISEIGIMLGELWDAVPEPLKRLLSGGAEIAMRTTPLGMAYTAAQAATGGDSFEQRRQGAAREETQQMLANMGVVLPGFGAPAAASATPAAATRAAATAATARGGGGRTVNANQRVEVRVNGLVDPNQLANAMRPHIEEALRASNEDALAGLADTAETPP